MNNEISIWNGCSVYGDIKELDGIVESEGFIKLDKDDIMKVLSAEGENYVSAGVNANIGDAYNDALNNLQCPISAVNSMLIDFRCGSKSPVMSEFAVIQDTLSKANPDIDIIWGVTSDKTLGESCKVVLVASAET